MPCWTGPWLFLADNLNDLGAVVSTRERGLPLTISGRLLPGTYTMDASESSQHISGLLYALPLLDGKTEIHLVNPVSKPYMSLTIKC